MNALMPGLSRVYVATSVPAMAAFSATEAQGNVYLIRRLYACSLASGARDTAESVTSWLARWTTKPLNPSAIVELVAHPAV
jgi:hypothetical protein